MKVLAYSLDIPVIVADNWQPKAFLDTWVERIDKDFSNACERVGCADLERTIFEVVSNSGRRHQERGRALRNEMGVGYDKKTAKERIVETIRKADQDLVVE